MSVNSFLELASPAPDVEAPNVEAPYSSSRSFAGQVYVKAAYESIGSAIVEPAPKTDPAVLFDDPAKFGPKLLPADVSSLSVIALRGRETVFESEAACIKGGVEKNAMRRLLPFLYDERDFVSFGEVVRFILVTGNVIFVYGHKTDPTPLYSIDVDSVRGLIEDPNNPDPHSYTISPQIGTNKAATYLATVLLKDRFTGKQAFQITFDTSHDNTVVKRFMEAIQSNAKHYAGEVAAAAVINAT
jgi:hypothetical protein